MTPRERAERAQQLLDDKLLKSVFADIRERLVANLEATPFGDIDSQHEIALSLQALAGIKRQLQTYLNDAAIEKARADNETWLAKVRQTVRL